VKSAGITSMIPAQCNCPVDWITFPGRAFHGEHNTVNERHVSADYLPTLKAGLMRGRLFPDAADASTPGVVIINQSLARKYFAGEDPIGQKIADYEGGHSSLHEVIGIVTDIREGPLDVDVWPAEYFPINQTQDTDFTLVVRTHQDAGALLPVLVSTLHQIDLNLGISDEETMREQIDSTQTALLHRFSAWLVGGFAMLAMILAVVGLYGVIAYSVSQRTREIGVRMALGAQRGSIYRLILHEAGRLAAIGLASGILCSLGTGRLIGTLLFGVRPWDISTLTLVTGGLLASALLACYIPARRATKVDPIVALRYE
jgi:predicted permease